MSFPEPLVLYDFPGSPCARRVRITLLEKGLPYRRRIVDLTRMEQKDPAYLKINPNGKVPALVHGDRVLFESNVITQYLDDIFPETRLYPEDPWENAQVKMWQSFEQSWVSEFKPLMYQRVIGPIRRLTRTLDEALEEVRRSTDDPTYLEWERKVHALEVVTDEEAAQCARLLYHRLDRLELALEGREFLVGQHFTQADISVYPRVRLYEAVRLPIAPERYPHVTRWMRTLEKRPSFARSHATSDRIIEWLGSSRILEWLGKVLKQPPDTLTWQERLKLKVLKQVLSKDQSAEIGALKWLLRLKRRLRPRVPTSRGVNTPASPRPVDAPAASPRSGEGPVAAPRSGDDPVAAPRSGDVPAASPRSGDGPVAAPRSGEGLTSLPRLIQPPRGSGAPLVLYESPLSPRAARVRAVLEEKGLAFESRPVDLALMEHLTERYLELNPTGNVPTLVHGERVLYDASLITEYLDEVFRPSGEMPLYPEEPFDRARARMWIAFDEGADELYQTLLFHRVISSRLRQNPPVDRTLQDVRARIAHDAHRRFADAVHRGELLTPRDEALACDQLYRRLAHVEQSLESGEYLVGDRRTIADITLFSRISRFPLLSLPVEAARFPRITAWMARLQPQERETSSSAEGA